MSVKLMPSDLLAVALFILAAIIAVCAIVGGAK